MAVKNINELYVDELKDLYSAERQLVEMLPRVAKAATSPELTKAVEMHLEQTKNQMTRLETICESLGEKPTGKRCKAMEGLLEEAKGILEEVETGPLLDCALIAAAQKVEHYEIASYGTVRAWAELLGKTEHCDLLQATLDEECSTDENLTKLAYEAINPAACNQKEMAGKAS